MSKIALIGVALFEFGTVPTKFETHDHRANKALLSAEERGEEKEAEGEKEKGGKKRIQKERRQERVKAEMKWGNARGWCAAHRHVTPFSLINPLPVRLSLSFSSASPLIYRIRSHRHTYDRLLRGIRLSHILIGIIGLG